MTDTYTPEKRWTTAAGLPAAITMHQELQHLCGYVGVYPDHPLYRVKYCDETVALSRARYRLLHSRVKDEHRSVSLMASILSGKIGTRPDEVLMVHGGITYSDGTTLYGYPDKRPDTWWFGFDCAHMGDYAPGLGRPPRDDEVFRDATYVTDECESLAQQLVDVWRDA